MKSLFKWIFITLLSVAALIAIGLAVLLFVIDPNHYKSEIEQLASKQGVELRINGDLGWQLLPNVAITVGNTELSGTELPDVAIKQTSLSLDLKQLITGRIAVHEVTISDPLIRIHLTDQNAIEQAAAVAAAPAAAVQSQHQSQTESSADSAIDLNIKSLLIENGTLELIDDNKVQQRIDNLNISGQQLNLEQRPFPLSITLQGAIPEVAEQANISLNTHIKLDSNFQQFAFSNTALEAQIVSQQLGSHKLSADFDAELDIAKNQLQLPQAIFLIDNIPLHLNAVIEQLTDNPAVIGKLEIPAFAPQPLLTNLDIELAEFPIKQIAFGTEFRTGDNHYQLSNLSLTMDDFTVTGQVDAGFDETNNIKALLKGGKLNLDRYLPANSDEQASNSIATDISQPEALFTPLLAPLAMLNDGNGQVEINLQQLIASGVQLDNIHLNAFSNGPVIRVADLSADGFKGSIKSDARIDLSQTTPKLQINLAASSVDVGAALSKLADFNELSGHGDLTFKGATTGNSTDELTNNLQGSGSFALNQPAYSATNIEQLFCQVAGDRKQNISWPKGSQFDNATGSFQLQPGQVLQLKQLNTGVGNIKLTGKGAMVLPDNTMDMRLTFNIQGRYSSGDGNDPQATGCKLRSKSIQNRDIPLRLRGSVDDLNSMLTNGLLELLTTMAVEDKASKLLDKWLGSDRDNDTDTDSKLRSEQETDSKDALKGLLKDLLKKK